MLDISAVVLEQAEELQGQLWKVLLAQISEQASDLLYVYDSLRLSIYMASRQLCWGPRANPQFVAEFFDSALQEAQEALAAQGQE